MDVNKKKSAVWKKWTNERKVEAIKVNIEMVKKDAENRER